MLMIMKCLAHRYAIMRDFITNQKCIQLRINQYIVAAILKIQAGKKRLDRYGWNGIVSSKSQLKMQQKTAAQTAPKKNEQNRMLLLIVCFSFVQKVKQNYAYT